MDATRRDFFATMHPALLLGFFTCVIGLTVLVASPLFATVSLGSAVLYRLAARGRCGWRLLGVLAPLLVAVAALNPLLNTEGATVLFTYGAGRPYTAEALAWGAVTAAMLGATLLWFSEMGRVLTSDKVVFLLGGAAPALATALMLALRLVPAYGRRAAALATAREGMGRGLRGTAGLRGKAAFGATLLSALTSWALEGGVTAADSMAARGFGTGRRTVYGRYRLSARDGALAALMIALLAAVAIGLASGAGAAEFLPQVVLPAPTAPVVASWAAFGAFAALPVLVNGVGEVQWRCSLSRI